MTKKREGQGAQQIGEIMGDLVAQAQAKAALPPPKRQTKKITPAGLILTGADRSPVVTMTICSASQRRPRARPSRLRHPVGIGSRQVTTDVGLGRSTATTGQSLPACRELSRFVHQLKMAGVQIAHRWHKSNF